MSRYLTFRLAGDDYGLGLLDVHEIIGLPPITRVPLAPRAVRGVINLRGAVIPVVDLKRQFELPGGRAESCVVVVRVHGLQLGLVVDEVSDVVEIGDGAIRPPPPFDGGDRAHCVIGVAAVGGRVCLLLDADRVLCYAGMQ